MSSSSWPGCLSNSVTHFFFLSPLFGVLPVFLCTSVTSIFEYIYLFSPISWNPNCCFWLTSFTFLSKGFLTCARAFCRGKTGIYKLTHTRSFSTHSKMGNKRTDLLSGVNGRWWKKHHAKRRRRVLQLKMRDVITDKLFGEYSVTYWKGKKC